MAESFPVPVGYHFVSNSILGGCNPSRSAGVGLDERSEELRICPYVNQRISGAANWKARRRDCREVRPRSAVSRTGRRCRSGPMCRRGWAAGSWSRKKTCLTRILMPRGSDGEISASFGGDDELKGPLRFGGDPPGRCRGRG